jgi:hypothetical protein
MAFRTWARLSAATLGVAALAGAGQLGLVYGLGIVRLTRVLDVTTRDQWTAQLAWVAWIPMLAAVVGALTGAALLRRWSSFAPTPGVGAELALAFPAAIGAAVVVPLTMQPARTAQVADVNPVVVIAICAGVGALIGLFAAWAALAQAVARWSLIAMGAAVWAVALISVAPSLAPSDPLPAVRLGVFDAGFLSPAVTQRTALATMPALALVIGALLGWTARRRDMPTLTIALAGLPGPALLTIAYLIAGPGGGADRYQVVPYWAAMTATGAGVLGSVLAAVLRRDPDDEDEDGTEGSALETSPLPRLTHQPESAIAATGTPSSPAGDPHRRPVDSGVLDLPQRDRAAAAPPGPAGAGAGPASGRSAGAGSADAGSAGAGSIGAGSAGAGPVGVGAVGAGRTGELPSARPGGAADETPATRPRSAPGAQPDPEPYVPEPATRPLPPGVTTSVQEPVQPRGIGGRLGRGLRSFGLGKSADPLTPEPTPLSAPLPHPDPVTPPPAVTPAPPTVGDTPDSKRKPKGGQDEDYVDWVSGLGK